MYDLNSVRRKINKEGVDNFISDLSSENLNKDVKNDLSICGILVNGYPNLSLIYSLI